VYSGCIMDYVCVNTFLLYCLDPVLMSDTTSMYRTSQQIGNGEHSELSFFCVVEITFHFRSGVYFVCLLSQSRLQSVPYVCIWQCCT